MNKENEKKTILLRSTILSIARLTEEIKKIENERLSIGEIMGYADAGLLIDQESANKINDRKQRLTLLKLELDEQIKKQERIKALPPLERKWTGSTLVIPRKGPKIGRNDPCSCGSGKKNKRCCKNNL